jgi:hypothetical protein
MFSAFLFLFAPYTSCLSLQISEVEEFGPPHPASADHIDPIDPGRMQRENPFNSNPIGDFPHSESRSVPSLLLTNDHSFEGLDPLLLSFYNLHVDLYRIPNPEIGEVCPQLFSFNQLHRVHRFLPPVQFWNADCGVWNKNRKLMS